MKKTLKNLNQEYVLDTTFDAANQKTTILLSIASAITFVLTFVICLLLKKDAKYSFEWWVVMLIVVMPVLAVLLRDLIHLLILKLIVKTKVNTRFAGLSIIAWSKELYLSRKTFLLSILLPHLIICTLLIVALVFANNNLYMLLIVTASIIFATMISDIYIALKLLLLNDKHTYIKDDGVRIKVYRS